MKTIVEALQDLYVALGGKEEDVANLVLNPDLIEKIAEVVPSGSGLPKVTVEDAGDVLTVSDEGEWEAAAPSGGGGIPVYSMVWGTPNYDDGFIPRYVNVDGTPADVFVVNIELNDVDPPPTLESGWHLTGEVFDKDYSSVYIYDGKYTASITGEVYRFVDVQEHIFYMGQDETGYSLGYVITNNL